MFRKRLFPVMLLLIGAQYSYAVLAVTQLRSGFKAAVTGPPQVPFTLCLFVLGLASVIASFPIAQTCARRQATELNFTTAAPALQKQFFVGFALSQIASLAGLLLFFVYADINPLLLLASLTSVAIAMHYVRVKKAIDRIERAHT